MHPSVRKVSQVYYVDENFVEELAQKSKSDFFTASLKFYRSVKDKNVGELSAKQIQWLTKLRDIVDNKVQQRINRQIFDYAPKVTKRFTWWPKKTKYGWVWLNYYEFN